MREHVFARAINSILKDNKFDRYVGNKRQGKLDFNNLARVSYSDKVFKKKEARKNKKYNVMVLCDCSGSMRETSDGKSRYSVVTESIEFLTNAFNKTDLDFSVWSFAGDILCLKDFEEKTKGVDVADKYKKHRQSNIVYCTSCNVINIQDTTEGSRCPYCKGILNYRSTNSFNNDGLALHLAQEALHNREGEKILIILSDGEADTISYYHMRYLTKDGVVYGDFPVKKVVQSITKENKIILCSIGIQSKAVQKIYPANNTRVVSDINNITREIISLIKPKIKRG